MQKLKEIMFNNTIDKNQYSLFFYKKYGKDYHIKIIKYCVNKFDRILKILNV